jgi:aryl-alcohol dehydrogenase-like predicted oxidoreductase
MESATGNQGQPFSKEELKQAIKAFKKRLKLTRLDAESSISGGPLSHNRANIVAITPPNQFPQAVWDELVRQGKLKKAGHGTYELVGE